MALHEWQHECLDLWVKNGCRGIVNAVTGSGKTVLALESIVLLEAKTERELRVKIVVPQTFLATQWKDEIKRWLLEHSADIGIYSGKHKDLNKKYMIYVVNSARYCLARHILSDINSGYAVLLIADECHHYGSAENNRIFSFYNALATDAPYYALGLSATPEIVDFRAISIPLGREIYYYDLKRALDDRIISRFILYSVRLNFTGHEISEYAELSASLLKCLTMLKKSHPELAGMPTGAFFAYLQKLAKQASDSALTAQTALTLMYSRRTLCHMAAERPLCAISIIEALPVRLKIILFCERIKAAEILYSLLEKQYQDQVGLYHSKMSENARRIILEQYKHGAVRILICCKALDEGLNIPSTDAGIIVSTSLSARQRVQRLGRMLRHSREIKRIYFLYIGDSSEEHELMLGLKPLGRSVPFITLRYQGNAYRHTEYEKLRSRVLEFISSHRNDPGLIAAMDKHIDRALLRGDFLFSEQSCRDFIRESRKTTERNYWVTVLYIILARLDKL